jgi:hypothetical protein
VDGEDAQLNMEFILYGDPDLTVYVDSIKVYDIRGEEIVKFHLGFLTNDTIEADCRKIICNW